ncbi:MAG: heme lyase CcmF/NrfE family subunit [Candidatus Endonucleobacter sp. (ex Gigantidas childressi)]|nr:heme lyase CcmF/NrfE family subunit [Candidatus Endonucleobacter sp. (ex Gigantidas childressi)]
MIPETGLLALLVALCLTVLLSIIPLIGSYTGNVQWMNQARSLAYGQFTLILYAFCCLVWAFMSDDFSVDYVARNSSSLLPMRYKFSAAWAGHEGSLLLWMLTLAGWMAAVALRSSRLPLELSARVLSVMGMISVGFLLFMILTSNPFTRILPFPPIDGVDLNPLLQDIGLIIHPPILYMGYVGFSVSFAFAIAALLGGQLDSAWARWVRPWTTVAWGFLTVGIALGSWWAYYELGWGGWWFWDPVENASLMPWLMGTALIHSLAVTEKRGLFKSWTLLLAIFTFSLSLLGTFLVRSGVLTSVHAFANDPGRGVFILIYLLTIAGCSLTLFAFRAPKINSNISFYWLSKETLLLINNILLTVCAGTVLLGTLFPLVLESLDMGMVSVGPPYFNALFVPMVMLLALALGVGVLINWKGGSLTWLIHQVKWIFMTSLIVGAIFSLTYSNKFIIREIVAIGLAAWIVLIMAKDIFNKTRHAGLANGIKRLQPAYYGMHLAHLGLAVAIIGVTISFGYSQQKDIRLSSGESVTLDEYQFRFDGVERRSGPNYLSDYATVTVFRNNHQITVMHPEKRMFQGKGMPMTETAIDGGFTRDLYVALGEPLDEEGNSWAVRVHVKPFIRWIWLGALLMASGGFLAISDKRYRLKTTNSGKSKDDDLQLNNANQIAGEKT